MARKKKIKEKSPVSLRFKKLANGGYSLYLDIYTNGKRYYEFLKLYLVEETTDEARVRNVNTMTAANAIKSQRILEIANGKANIKNKSNLAKVLLSDWMEHYTAHKKRVGCSDNFLKQIRKTTKHLISFNAKVELKDIDKEFVLSFIEYLRNRKKADGSILSSTTAKCYFKCFNCALNYAVKEEIISVNPITLLTSDERIKAEESKREYLSVDEVLRLINTPCKNEMVRCAFLFSCFCGLRISDIKALKWSDISMDNGRFVISIIIQKTKNALSLPLSDEAVKYLPTPQDSQFVFDLPSEGYLNRLLKEWAKAADIKKPVSFHVARHTFATMTLTAGADIYTACALLGHTQVKTTQIYAKIIDKKKDSAVDLVSNMFNNKD